MATLDDVLTTIDINQSAALNRLFELMKIPSVSTDPSFHAECLRAADWLVDDLKSIGFSAASIATPSTSLPDWVTLGLTESLLQHPVVPLR